MGDRNRVYMLQDTVSVHRPGFYAHRFLDFCADRVFKKIPSREYCRSFVSGSVHLRFDPFPIYHPSCRTKRLPHPPRSIQGKTPGCVISPHTWMRFRASYLRDFALHWSGCVIQLKSVRVSLSIHSVVMRCVTLHL